MLWTNCDIGSPIDQVPMWMQILMQIKSTVMKTKSVYLFIPNLIDYCRVVLLFLFCYNAWSEDYAMAACFYAVNFALDEVDGNSARYFKQTSVFGMVLDVLIDEASVTCLCMTLGMLYPSYIILFQLHTTLDFCAQWVHYIFTALYRNNNHTTTDDRILNVYFNRYVLTLLWVYGNHMFLLMLYVCYYTDGPQVFLFGWSVGVFRLAAYMFAPWSISRLVIMLYLLITSFQKLAYHDQLKYASRTREVSHDQLKCASRTREVSHDQLKCASGTREVSHDQLKCASRTREVSHDQLKCASRTREVSHDQLKCASRTREVKTGDVSTSNGIVTSNEHTNGHVQMCTSVKKELNIGDVVINNGRTTNKGHIMDCHISNNVHTHNNEHNHGHVQNLRNGCNGYCDKYS